MSNFAIKKKSFRNLRILFLSSLIVVTLSLMMTVITTTLQNAGVLDNNVPAAQGINAMNWILGILKVLIFVCILVIVILGVKINKNTKRSLFFAIGCSVFVIVGLIVQAATNYYIVGLSFSLIGCVLYVLSILLFIDGLFEGKARKEPWMIVISISLGLIIIAEIQTFISIAVKFARGYNLALSLVAQTCFVISFLFLFVAIMEIEKAYNKIHSEPKEVE